ncbi:hypothetical protein [Tessaracoccus antarcticus]|uniref:hypothetical protein n=1 Tax=Tessaracoccus antarcticus TaxID=2479848 RepID=UPI0011C38C1D|nr:hypothetical protein [Tessaracoccus antarcticus]
MRGPDRGLIPTTQRERDAAQAVSGVAEDAGETIKQDAAAATDQVVGQAQSSADTVRGDAGVAVEQTKDDTRQARAAS